MQIPFYFDYACPWAYLGSCRVEPYFKDLGAEIDFRPVHLATLKEPGAGKGPELGERKRKNLLADIRHWAEMIGAELSPDSRKRYPDTKLLLQAALVALVAGCLWAFRPPRL